MPVTAYLSLGSNLGDREANLREAIRRMAGLGAVNKTSSLYETEPVEFTEQPWFVNCAVEVETSLSPRELLNAMLAVEHAMGRKRTQPKGPRLIDLDILLYDDAVLQEHGLTIPHPAMHERRFVLDPLAEIAPNAVHPVLKKRIRELLDTLPHNSGQVRKIASTGK